MSIETLSTYLCVTLGFMDRVVVITYLYPNYQLLSKSFNLNQLMIMKISETRFVDGWLWLKLAMNFKATDVSTVERFPKQHFN